MSKLIWKLPNNLLAESVRIMRPRGTLGNEGLALWFGYETAAEVIATHVVDVSGPGFVSSPLHMRLSYKAMSKLTDLSEQLDRCLIGQIHSHPGLMLDLSDVDKSRGIRTPNYLSVVCPYYAQRDIHTFEECGVHVFEATRYRRLDQTEISRRLAISHTPVIPLRIEVPA